MYVLLWKCDDSTEQETLNEQDDGAIEWVNIDGT